MHFKALLCEMRMQIMKLHSCTEAMRCTSDLSLPLLKAGQEMVLAVGLWLQTGSRVCTFEV